MTFVDFSQNNIGLKGRYVFVNRLESHGELGVIVSHVNRFFNNPQTKRLSLRLSADTPMYGNLVVPLSVMLVGLKESGKEIVLHTESDHLNEFCVLNPPVASSKNFSESKRILDKVWRIENEFHLNNTVEFLRIFFRGRLGLNEDAVNVLELAIIEGIENSLIHSNTGRCFFMGQLHRKQNYFTLCMSDSGIGIQKSLADGGLVFSKEPESLASAIKKGTTSKHFENRGGNGLYCLSRLAKINRGHFCLWSGASSIVVDGKTDNDRVLEYLPSIRFLDRCTHLDFQIPLSADVSADYDESPSEGFESMVITADANGFNTLVVSELEAGYCTRHAGQKAQEIVGRLLEFPTVVGVMIDFAGISICSMSFLDSFLGVLCKRIGIKEFNERIRIKNATQEIRKSVFRVTKSG